MNLQSLSTNTYHKNEGINQNGLRLRVMKEMFVFHGSENITMVMLVYFKYSMKYSDVLNFKRITVLERRRVPLKFAIYIYIYIRSYFSLVFKKYNNVSSIFKNQLM
jgi:hypothetical protein